MNTKTITRTESFDCDGPAELDIRIRGGRIEVRTADVAHVRVEISAEPGDPRQWEQGVEDLLGTISQGAYTPDEADAHSVAETKVEFSDQRRKLVVRAPRSFRRTGLAVVVEAPRHSKLKAGAQRGSISTSGLLSGLRAATGSGSIVSEEVEGAGRRGHRLGSGHARPRLRPTQGSSRLRRPRGRLDRGRRRVRHHRARGDLARRRALRRASCAPGAEASSSRRPPAAT